MPVHAVPGGYRWGDHGKVYPSRADAVRQGAAAHANGYKEKAAAKGGPLEAVMRAFDRHFAARAAPAQKGDAFDAPFQQAWGAPFPMPDTTTEPPEFPDPDTSTAEAEDWRAQGDGLVIRSIEAAAKAKPLHVRVAAHRAAIAKGDGDGPERDHVHAGIPLKIDRPKGFVQTGSAPDGSTWRRIYRYDYGYVPGTEGGDGEGLDVYVGPDGEEDAPLAYWAAQLGHDGSFDEWKVFLGFPSAARARLAWRMHSPMHLLGALYSMPLTAMRAMLGLEPRPPVEKAEEGDEEAEEVSEGAREAAERIGELGEGHGGHGGAHGGGHKGGAHEKKPHAAKPHAEHEGGHEGGEKKPAEKPKHTGGGDGRARDEHGRFASK